MEEARLEKLHLGMNNLKETVLKNPPAFHFWQKKPQTGGFTGADFEDFEYVVANFYQRDQSTHEPPAMIETGAGLSTLWFLAMGFHVVSFSMPDVIENMEGFLSSNFEEIKKRWTPIAGESERNIIPQLAKNPQNLYDVALIDGNHAVPAVFADFVALNLYLRQGGILFVDDIQLPGPSLLKQFLMQSKGDWTPVFQSGRGKWECFQKKRNISISRGNAPDFKFQFPHANQNLAKRSREKLKRILKYSQKNI